LEVSDLELVRSAVAGDDGAFHALVDRHAKALFRVALSLSRNRADAEDLFQETLVAAFRGLKNFAGRSSVKTWLLKILTRQAYKSWTRAKHRRTTLSIDAMDEQRPSNGAADGALTTQGATDDIERRIDVMALLQNLTDPHREVLVLREIQGLSYDEIAEVLGVPRGTVESRLFRARAEFRERFAGVFDETRGRTG
jgi:RNA polymerase sigma-70 factor (ECF subfamily)